MAERRVNTIVAFVYAVLTYALLFPTWPNRLRTHIPGDAGDALLNLWILDWVGHHIDDGWGSLWDTTIFFPYENTLAYSESLLPVAIVHRAVAVVLRSDVMAFNLIHLAAWFASMWFTYLLARRLTGSVAGAFVAGLVYTLATPRLAHYWHFQLAFGFLVPVVIYAILRFFEQPTRRRALALGFAAGGIVLSTSYYGLMTAIAAAIIVGGLLVWGRGEGWRAPVKGLAVAGTVAALLVAPVAYQYAQLQRDDHFQRGYEAGGSAHVGDFTRVTHDHYVLGEYGPLAARSQPADGSLERRLFPGGVALGLGGVGVMIVARDLWRRRRPRDRDLAQRLLALIVLAGAVLFVLSFGDKTTIGSRTIWMPYALLRELPGFAGIRAPARFVAFSILALALLAAIGFARVTGRRSVRVTITALVLCSGLLVAESALQVQFLRVPDRNRARAVNEELATRPDGTVVELPITSPADGATWAFVETPRQWLARIDGNERVGGYSGFDPPGFVELVAALDTFPAADGLATADRLDVRYVVVRTALPGPLPEFLARVVDRDGVGWYSDAYAAELVGDIPPERVANARRYGDAWLVELQD
ncbi:MAG: hypothetical protein ACT4OX_02875 [Actinomycetota bacterium]